MRVERVRLREIAWEPVEHEADGSVLTREPVADQRHGEVVGHELAGGEDRLAPARPSSDASAIAARNMSPVAMCGMP